MPNSLPKQTFLALLLILSALPALAFTVTTTVDRNGVCLPGGCSLREAADHIVLAAGQTYTLTIAGADEGADATPVATSGVAKLSVNRGMARGAALFCAATVPTAVVV